MPAATRPLVLIADDTEDMRQVSAEYFEYRDYRVATAQDGQEALDLALALLPDIILLDLSMPVLDGLEATRRLRSDERIRHIPVIALTGHAMQSSIDEGPRGGIRCRGDETLPTQGP